MTKDQELARLDTFIAEMAGTYIGDSLRSLRYEIEANIRSDFPAIDFADVTRRLNAVREEIKAEENQRQQLREANAQRTRELAELTAKVDRLENVRHERLRQLRIAAESALADIRAWATAAP